MFTIIKEGTKYRLLDDSSAFRSIDMGLFSSRAAAQRYIKQLL